MKTKKKFLGVLFYSALLIAFFSIGRLQAGIEIDTTNPCWRLLYPDDPIHGSYNPDSVMIDTCATTRPMFPVLYAYKWFKILLPPGALNVPWAPRDSLIIRNWRDIDTNFTELRNGFQNLENKFSPFIMKKEFPDIIDTLEGASGLYLLKFEKYFNIDTLVIYLKLINGIYDANYDMRATQLLNNIIDINSQEAKTDIEIEQKTNDNRIEIYIHKFQRLCKTIDIYNLNLKKILQYHMLNNNNTHIILDISNLTTGIYFLHYGNIIKSFIILN